MAAPSLAALLDIETAFETAAQGVLTTSGITSFISQNAGRLPDTSTGVQFDLGPAYDELTFLPKGGQAVQIEQEFFRYSGALTLQVSVKRDDPTAPTQPGVATFLGQLRGLIRAAFLQSQWPFDDSNLPYYRVSQIRPDGTNTGWDQERNVDLISLRFAIDFAIQPTAWPTGFPPS